MKKIRVFYAVQVSNYTKTPNGEKWLIRNDACTNIAVGIISSILEKYPTTFEFVLKLPFLKDCDDISNYEELFENKYLDRIVFYEDHIPISPIVSRFHFDMQYHTYMGCDEQEKRIYRLKDIDVMINDENTLTKNWRVFFDSIGNKKIKIISTNYFLDSPLSNKVESKIRYYERQMESFICSDLAAFQCEPGRLEAMDAYNLLYKSTKILAPQSVWGVGAHYSEIKKYHSEVKFKTPTIYFGNRITESVDRYTNYDIFAKAIGMLCDMTEKPFDALMLNPTRKVSQDQLHYINKLSNGKVRVIPNDEKFTRKDYLKFINKSHISCNLFVNEVHGGVTHCEALMAGNMVIMPKVNNYLYKFKAANEEKYPLFCKIDIENTSKPDAKDLADKLLIALDSIGNQQEIDIRNTCQKIGYEYESYERACDRIVDDIMSLIK